MFCVMCVSFSVNLFGHVSVYILTLELFLFTLIYFETRSHYVIEASLELEIFYFNLPRTGATSVWSYPA